jgi:hypothetical protein
VEGRECAAKARGGGTVTIKATIAAAVTGEVMRRRPLGSKVEERARVTDERARAVSGCGSGAVLAAGERGGAALA